MPISSPFMLFFFSSFPEHVEWIDSAIIVQLCDKVTKKILSLTNTHYTLIVDVVAVLLLRNFFFFFNFANLLFFPSHRDSTPETPLYAETLIFDTRAKIL